MAEKVYEVATSHEAPPTPVQELMMQMSAEGNGHVHIPEMYLNRLSVQDDNPVVDDGFLPMMEADMIDLTLLSSQRADELAKLRSLLTSWSCFELVNHGMSSGFLDQVRQASRQFFALPQEEKNKYARPADSINGYGNDNAYGKKATVDWSDRLELLVHPECQRSLQFWPHNLRDILDEYTLKLKDIAVGLLKAMALALDLEENSFVDMYGEEAFMLARINYYPPCPRPDLVLGARPHTDGSAVTILLLDDQVESLQAHKDDEWFRVATNPHSLFVVVGDQMEIMSNGLFKSSLHRVITNAERDRLSVVMFCGPAADIEIRPPVKLITEGRPQLFHPIKNYGTIFFQVDPGSDERAIDLIRVQNS